MREATRSGMERLQGVGFLARTQELDRFAGDVAHRKRCATTGVAIGLGQHDAGQRQGVIECRSGVGRVLTGHGIDHEQGFVRLDRGMHVANFRHHLCIDMQASGSIHQQHVAHLAACFGHRITGYISRLLAND